MKVNCRILVIFRVFYVMHLIPEDIPDADVREWYYKRFPACYREWYYKSFPTCYYIATQGLGETVLQTPLMRYLCNLGYHVILVLRSNYASAFYNCSYLGVLSLSEEELNYTNNCVSFSDSALKKFDFSNPRSILFYCGRLCIDSFFSAVTVYDASNPFGAKTEKNVRSNFLECWSSIHNIFLDDFRLDLGISRKPSSRISIGIGVGSGEIFRKLPRFIVDSLCASLVDSYDVYLLGCDFTGEFSDCSNCFNYMSNGFGSDSLLFSLSKLSEVHLLIGPDSGFTYCSLSMGIPNLLIETRVTHTQFHSSLLPLLDFYRVFNPSCSQECHPRRHEFTGSHFHISSHGYPHNLECKRLGVKCINELDIDILCDQVHGIFERRITLNSNFKLPKGSSLIAPDNISGVLDINRNGLHKLIELSRHLNLPIRNYPADFWFISAVSHEEMYTLLNILGSDLDLVIELGLARGGTHFIFSQISDQVISIDKELSCIVATSSMMRLCGYDNGKHRYIHGYTQDESVKGSLGASVDIKADVLFIDADHNYDVCLADHDEYKNFVKVGGYIVFDDACTEPGVLEAITNISERDNISFTFIYGDGGQGLAYYQVDS